MQRLSMFVCAGLVASVLAPGASRQTGSPLDGLAWMAGCWRSERGGVLSEEQWMAPAGGAMFGTSRTVRDGRLVEFEFLEIRARDGGVDYVAHPSGQATTTFTLRAPDDDGRDAVFENPEHDFPRRIVYRREPDGSMHARIEGERRGQTQVIDFSKARVSCPPQRPPSGGPRWPG